MRGFMRAIGGLLRGSGSRGNSVTNNNSISGFRPISPGQLQEAFNRSTRSFSNESHASSRSSSGSILDKPQFLFFCGSDSSSTSPSASSSTLASRLAAMHVNVVPAPAISHKMPVFIMDHSPSAAASRGRFSVFYE